MTDCKSRDLCPIYEGRTASKNLASLDLLDLRLPDHLGPALDLGFHHGGELVRGVGFRRVADEVQLLPSRPAAR